MEQKLLKKKRIYMAKGNSEQLAKICRQLADEYNETGEYGLAKNEYRNESEIYKKLKMPMQFALSCRMVGEMCTFLGEYEESLSNMKIYLRIAKEQKDVLEEMKAHASLGRTYLTKAIQDPEDIVIELLDLAHIEFEESLSICDKSGYTTTEIHDMKARLLRNIGVIKEIQNKFDEAEDYMLRSIKIYDNSQLYDGLHEGYHTLGQMYVKKCDYKQALSSFNLALNIAERLSNKKKALCSSYMKKSNVLIILGEFTSAQRILIKAYKLNALNLDDDVESTLRVATALCRMEDELVAISLTDYKRRKKIYERMGDGCCTLKAFKKAIEFYQKMLDCALKNGESGKDLLSVYVSLAQTYKDDKQYELAYDYFQKELEISGNNPVEAMKTLLSITDILPKLFEPHERIVETFNKARENAIAAGDIHYEGKIINDYIVYLNNIGRKVEAEKLHNEPAFVEYEPSSESDVEGDDRPETPSLGNDIDLNKLLKEFDDEDSEPEKTRRRAKRFVVKRNNRGETQLHKACIDGNVELVKKLLDQEHPVNVRDYCGWLPIHEACCTGSIEIVKLLIEKGASINDRDGEKCKGYTPLHSACSNGYLKLIEFMLNNGASALIQSDDGLYPLDILRKWGNDDDKDPETQSMYNSVVQRMSLILQKAGRHVKRINEITTSDVYYVEGAEPSVLRRVPIDPEPSVRRVSSEKKSARVSKSPKENTSQKSVGSLRRTLDLDLDEDLKETSTSRLSRHSSLERIDSSKNTMKRNLSHTSINDDSDSDACQEYKRAIEGLKSRTSSSKSLKISKVYSLAPDDNAIDNWLEDDLKSQRKKRKRDSNVRQNYLDSSGIRRTSSNLSINNDSDMENNEPIIFNDGYNSIDSLNSSSNKRRKNQISLLDSGFSRNRSESPSSNNSSPVTLVDKISKKPFIQQQKLSSFINRGDSGIDLISQISSVESTPQSIIRPILAVNVRIDNKLWRIPVPSYEVNDLTIEWLANEAAKRYYKQEGISPTLQLLTKEGAILVNEDPLSMIFITPTQAEEVQSNILSWNLPPLRDRYVEACQSSKIEPSAEVEKQLEECQGTLHLKLINISIAKIQFPIIFRALNRQNNLQQLELSDVLLENDAIQHLCSVLPSLNQVKTLNLSRNKITGEGVRMLSQVFKNEERTNFENLTELNLSFNEFGVDVLQHLFHTLKYLKLQILNLSACNLPENFFHGNNLILNLQYLDSIDLSYNNLNSKDISKFCTFLNFNCISNINFSYNKNVFQCGILKKIAEMLTEKDTNSIKNLILTKCCVTDSEIWDLLRALKNSSTLESLQVSFNNDLTSVSLRRLMQHRPSFGSLKILGCRNIYQYFEPFQITDPVSEYKCSNNLKLLKISIYSEKIAHILGEMWKKEWGSKATIKYTNKNRALFTVAD